MSSLITSLFKLSSALNLSSLLSFLSSSTSSLSTFTSSHFMFCHLSLRLPRFFYLQSFGSDIRRNRNTNAVIPSEFNGRGQGSSLLSKSKHSLEYLFKHYSTSSHATLRALSSTTVSTDDETNNEREVPTAKAEGNEMEFNRVNCLVWVLHESSRSFSLAVESLELDGSRMELAMAWNGKDVHEWHKRIAYKVAVYALVKMAIEVENLLSHERYNMPAPVKEILSSKIIVMGDFIENQLRTRHSELVQWFRIVELPRIAGYFSSLLKKWSMEYAGSGVAGIIVAISCCAAVRKLGPGRISCPMFYMSVEDASIQLMNISCSFVSVDKLHRLATDAGFEPEFLSHFGKKVLPNNTEELEFWIGLAQKKLFAAFHREGQLLGTKISHEKVQADSLATLGLFAYLARLTRKFLSILGIKDLDETVKDFLSYLECGSLFIYPEFSSISVFQLFIEIVTDEIGWLDFYAAFHSVCNQERRSKHHTIQAKKELILSNVFTVCYDVFSGFAHFSRSTQHPLEAELFAFLLQSQSLLTTCLDDYWAAYDRSSCGLLKIAETDSSDYVLSLGTKSTTRFSVALQPKENLTDLATQGIINNKSRHPSNLRKFSGLAVSDTATFDEETSDTKSNSLPEGLIKKYSIKFMSTSSDVWMGTQLLCIDIMMSLELFLRQLQGHKITMRERKKIKRTLSDIASLIPITILMLLPVSAIGHAAMLSAIKKYMPSMIPSPYSSERLDVVKQLKRTKKKGVQPQGNIDDPPTTS